MVEGILWNVKVSVSPWRICLFPIMYCCLVGTENGILQILICLTASPLLWLEYFQQHRKLWILWSQYGDLFYQSSTVRYLKCSCWLTKSWNLIYIVSFTNTVVDGMLRLKQHHNNCFLQNKENRNFCFVCIVITYMISKIACNFNEFMPLLYSMSVCITDFIAD